MIPFFFYYFHSPSPGFRTDYQCWNIFWRLHCGLFKKYLMHFTLVKGLRADGWPVVILFWKREAALEPFEGGEGPAITLQMGLQSTCMCGFFWGPCSLISASKEMDEHSGASRVELRWATACCSAVTMPALACIIYPPADWSRERHKRSNSTHTLNIRLTEC